MGTSKGADRAMLVAKAATGATGTVVATFRTGSYAQQGFHHHISWATGVTAGTVVIEYADDPAYAGTWAPVATIAWSATSPSQDYAYTPGQPKALRHRITVTVSGGASPSVTTRLVGVPA